MKPDLLQKIQAAVEFHQQGHLQIAEKEYREILKKSPDQLDTLYGLAVICHQTQRTLEATDLISRAIPARPDDADLHRVLGGLMDDLGRIDEAISSYQESLRLNPEDFLTQNDLGLTFFRLRKWDNAISCLQNALRLKPDFADAHNSLGHIHFTLGKWDLAKDAFQAAVDLDPNNVDAHANLGLSLNAQGRHEEALSHFQMKIELERGDNPIDPDLENFRFITKPKITHDILQFRYLESLGDDTKHFGDLADIYEALSREIIWREFKVSLTEDQRRRIADTYNKPFHIVDAPKIDRAALNPNLDIAAITDSYFDNGPGITYFDEMMTEPALQSLRRFLLESTIWYHIEHPEGYVGAYLIDGLGCPLLLQIAEELRLAFPEIFQDHRLKQLWAYRYDDQMSGINLHADDAAVNVNFWITPDSANLDPKKGGLIVYKAEAPRNWEHDLYNTSADTRHIREYLAENNEEAMVIPYAANRAGLFNSDLFHETDEFEFKPGFANRRINVTMLYGNRVE